MSIVAADPVGRVFHGGHFSVTTLRSPCGKIVQISARACWVRDLRLPRAGLL
jgi:hypothetical protein